MKKIVSILLILVLMFSLAAAVFADSVSSPEKENTNVEPNKSPASPQTGETGAIYWVIAAMVLAIGAALFCGKKLVLDK